MRHVSDALFTYLRDIIYAPNRASLDVNALPKDFRALGEGLICFGALIGETRELSLSLSEGELNCKLPPPTNQLAAPLKKLHSSLRHLTWQAQTVARGNYNQRVDFMGEFSDAFNDMIAQLKQRELDSLAEKERLRSFVAKMSHELRTPINAVLGMSELALREKMPDTSRSHVENIRQAGQTLLTIINDVLDFSKIESGKLDIIDAEYRPGRLVSDVCNIIRIQAEAKGLDFRFNMGEMPDVLVGDSIRLQQIMVNLLSNAVKYTDSGFVGIALRGEYTGDNKFILHIEVRDSGRGIKESDLNALFDEYSQFDAQCGIEGTGLGLAITKNLVTAMGGEIHVSSRYGEGSVFAVAVPQNVQSGEQDGSEALSRSHEQKPRAGIAHFTAPDARVLVVDDVDLNLLIAEGFLAPYKMTVELCASGAEALEKMTQTDFDIVFMDYMMPDMDGAETLSAIRKLPNGNTAATPVIMLSADVTDDAHLIFIKRGANDSLLKPLDEAKMNAVLRRWLPQEKIQ